MGPRVIALLDRVITNLRYPVHYACLVLLLLVAPHHPMAMVRLGLGCRRALSVQHAVLLT